MSIFSELATPSNFSRDWYGYATNQISHTALGFIAASLVAGAIIQSGALTVPDGANAIGISAGTSGDWAADFYCLGGRP